MSGQTDALALVQSNALTPAAAFAPGAIDKLLADIAEQARAHQPDLRTEKGRKEIASVAYKVARSKTALDDMGKQLVAEWKAKSSVVDAERRRVRDFLDSLSAEVRQPLTDYENAEKARLEAIKSRIEGIRELGYAESTSAGIREQIDRVKAVAVDDSFEAFKGDAALAKDFALNKLEAALASVLAAEEEAARIEAERIAQAAREAQERADREAAEAAARAAQAQREAAERAEREAFAEQQRQEAAARAEAERAERDRLAEERRAAELVAMQERAEADAKRREAEAAERERVRIQREAEAKAAEDARRAADQEHRRTVNNAALQAIVKVGLTPEQAKAVVLAIVSGEVPHVSIRY